MTDSDRPPSALAADDASPPHPPAVAPLAAAPLAYATAGATYKASGRASAVGVLAVVAGGLALAAVVGAALAALLLWDVRVPYIVTMVAPGVVIGLGVAWMIRRAKIRSRLAAGLIAGVCAAAAVAAVVGSLYVAAVYEYRDAVRAMLVARAAEASPDASPDDPAVRAIADGYVAEPFDLYDRTALIPAVGRGGPIGFLRSLTTKSRAFLLVAALFAVVAAVATTREVPARPFCEPCGRWYNEPYTAAVLPAELADPVVVALEADDTNQIRQIRRTWLDADLGTSCTVVQVYRCATCDALLADVAVMAGPAGTSTVMRPRRIDDAMRQALRRPEPEPARAVAAGGEPPTEPTKLSPGPDL